MDDKELTPQQELFCQKYLECKRNASEAYRQSYNCENSAPQTIYNEAHKLLHHRYVARRIRQLFDFQAERLNVTMESLTDEYEQARAAAMRAGEYSPAISATTGKAKLFGLIVDKVQELPPLASKEDLMEEAVKRGIPVESIFSK